MKKETLILLALLGFGLYRHFKSKPKQTEKKPDEYYIKGFRKIYDSVNGDASKAIPLGLALFREDESFRKMSEGTLVGVLESFINDFIKNPNYGL
jgi:hypothetical protein